MTRPTRMLLVLGAFAVAALAVLSLMAQRYGKLLQRVDRPPAGAAVTSARPSEPPATGAAAGTGTAEATETARERALRYVDAFLAVRRALQSSARETGAPGSPAGAAKIEASTDALDRALADAGLDRVTYEGMLEIYEAWKAGRPDVSGPLPAAFELRRAELEGLE